MAALSAVRAHISVSQFLGEKTMNRRSQWLFGMCLFMLSAVGLLNGLALAQASGDVPFFPKYIVLGVVYAPPGASSSVTYGSSTMVGSTDSVSAKTQASAVTTTSHTTGGGFLGFGTKKTTTSTTGWTTAYTQGSSVSIQTTSGNSISTMGPISSSLGVNHDNDIIYILLNPVTLSYTSFDGGGNIEGHPNWDGMDVNGCDAQTSNGQTNLYQQVNGCDPNQFPYPDIVGIPVWCLKNPYYPGQGCAQWLTYTSRAWDNSYMGPANGQGQTQPYPALPNGLTLQDYADILQADPFVTLNGNAINVCHPTYGADLDPNVPETVSNFLTASQIAQMNKVNMARQPLACAPVTLPGGTPETRFQPYGSVEYPEPGPNGLPSTYEGDFAYSHTDQTITTSTDTHTSGSSSEKTSSFSLSLSLSYGFPSGLGLGSLDLGNFEDSWTDGTSNTTTWQNSNSQDNSTQLQSTAKYSITGPQLSDNYTGPATYNVYLDNVYGTYAFYSPLEPKVTLGTIGISPAALTFAPTLVGATSSAQQVTLTNVSIYPVTMVWPAVTFTDPGFQIAQDGTDHCSNQFMQPNASCTLNIVFSPLFSDAPNQLTMVNDPSVQATMIAAGTENASSYQNILVTSQAALSASVPLPDYIAGGASQGALLIANDSNVSTLNPMPNMYKFGSITGSGSLSETFTFTNYTYPSVTLQASPGAQIFTFTDTADFAAVPSGGTPCFANTVVTYKNSCTFTVLYQPSAASINTGASGFGTAIGVTGVINSAARGVPSGVQTLALAGAAGFTSPGMTISDNRIDVMSDDCVLGFCTPGTSGSVQITNNTAAPMQISISYAPNVPNGSDNCGAVGPGASCTLFYDVPPDGQKAVFQGIDTVTGTAGALSYSQQVHVSAIEYVVIPCVAPIACAAGVVFTPTSGAAATQSVVAGGIAQYFFQLAPTGSTYPSVVTFSVTGLPAGATATFNPAHIAPTAGVTTVTMSVQTVVTKASLTVAAHSGTPMLAFVLLLVPLAYSRSGKKNREKLAVRYASLLVIACAIAAMSGLSGCSAGNAAMAPAPVDIHTYSILVTANSGSTTVSQTVSLTVQ